MLKGLEVSEVRWSETTRNKDFRIDSQFYTKAPIKNPNLEYKKIGTILEQTQYGISIEMNESNIGYPIYRMNEIHDMLCDLEINKCADITQEEYQRFALDNRDVLFNRTNSFEWVGKTGVYYQNDNIPRTYASYLVKLIPNTREILPEYLCTFLNSRFGVWDIKRRARQSINQTNVNPEEVKEIEIPILDMTLQEQLQMKFEVANAKRIEAKHLYSAAENQLLEELGLKDWQPQNENINVKTLKESFLSSGRLDAEYYQSKYDELQHKLKAYRDGYMNLSAMANTYRGNFISEEMYCDDVNCRAYIRGADISSNILTSDKCVYIDKKFVQTNENTCLLNDIVIALIGSVGTAARVTEEYVGSYISNNLGLIRITNDRIKSEYLHLFLTSQQIGKYFFEQKEMRTAQPKISDKDIWDFPIPLLSQSIQESICVKIQQSFALKAESKRLLEEAKMMVEQEIEKGGE